MGVLFKKHSRQCGIALLEFALIFLVLSGFFIGVSALTVQYQESTTLERLLTQALSEPLGAQYALDIEGRSPTIQREKINKFLRFKTEVLRSELTALYGSHLSYTISAGFAEYAQDVFNGSPCLIDSQQSMLHQQGVVRLGELEQKNLNLSTHFLGLTNSRLREKYSLFVSPTHQFAVDGDDPYRRVVVVGMAVAFSRQSSLLSEFLSSLTGSFATARVHLSYLRGAQL